MKEVNFERIINYVDYVNYVEQIIKFKKTFRIRWINSILIKISSRYIILKLNFFYIIFFYIFYILYIFLYIKVTSNMLCLCLYTYIIIIKFYKHKCINEQFSILIYINILNLIWIYFLIYFCTMLKNIYLYLFCLLFMIALKV